MAFIEIFLNCFVEFDLLLWVFSEAFFEAAQLTYCGEIIVQEWRVAFPRKSCFVPFAIVAAGVLNLKGFLVFGRKIIFFCRFSGCFFNIPVMSWKLIEVMFQWKRRNACASRRETSFGRSDGESVLDVKFVVIVGVWCIVKSCCGDRQRTRKTQKLYI